MTYLNRREAGQILAQSLLDYANRKDVIVLGLPRGGVPVGYEVARRLKVSLDVFVVRKLGVPTHEELAMGAIASGGTVFWDQAIIQAMQITEDDKATVLKFEREELARRENKYRSGRPCITLKGKTVLLVDDGIATGSTMIAAITSLKQKYPKQIIVAVPVAARETCATLSKMVDGLVCPVQPENFHAVGLWYKDFSQTTDEEVAKLLKQS